MVTQYVTFGQAHKHPDNEKPMKNCVVKVVAPTEHMGRAAVFARFGPKFSTTRYEYSENLYPEGIYETLIVSVDVFEGETAPELVPEESRLIAQHYESKFKPEEEPEPKLKTPGEEE